MAFLSQTATTVTGDGTLSISINADNDGVVYRGIELRNAITFDGSDVDVEMSGTKAASGLYQPYSNATNLKNKARLKLVTGDNEGCYSFNVDRDKKLLNIESGCVFEAKSGNQAIKTTDITNPATELGARVGDDGTLEGSSEWDKTTDLKTYKYVKIPYEHIHDWKYTYEWGEDNLSVHASRTCDLTDSLYTEAHTEEEEVASSGEVVKEPDCTTKGQTKYTSQAFENPAFEVQEKTVDDIDALGHDWDEPVYEWSDDNTQVTATRKCKRDPSHVETETVKTDAVVATKPTCEEMGETKYTATFENEAFATQVKTVADIAATGHDYGDWKVTTPATVDKEGVETRVCKNDPSHKETRPVDKLDPTPTPTTKPAGPTATPTAKPTTNPAGPTATPMAKPTTKPAGPTATPTAKPTTKPAGPTVTPTAKPTAKPTVKPTAKPTTAPAVSLKINKNSASVVCGKTLTLKATLKGAAGKITWKSSDRKIASVDASGKVTCKKAGTVTITASAAGKSASCKVTVTYKDVTNSSDFWYTPTNYLTAKGVVKGYDKQTNFKPANECTRAQMITFIWRLMGEPAPKAKTCKFTDVKTSDYFFKACIWGNEKHIVEGYKDGTFGPKIVCARKHAVTFLWRLAGKPAPKSTKNKFSDVKKSDYFYKATLWASEKKILEGYADGTFKPDGKCLRRQMVTFLYKYDKFVNGKG